MTREMSRGRWTAWPEAEMFGRNDFPKTVPKAPGTLDELTVAVTAVVATPARGG